MIGDCITLELFDTPEVHPIMLSLFQHCVIVHYKTLIGNDKWPLVHEYLLEKYGDDAIGWGADFQRHPGDSGWSYQHLEDNVGFYFDDLDAAIDFKLRFG